MSIWTGQPRAAQLSAVTTLARRGPRAVAAGARPGDSRHAAMFALAGQVPAPVLADLIGIADKTAVKWAALAARDWSAYIAQREPTRGTSDLLG